MKPTRHLHPKHPGQDDDYEYDSPELACPCPDGSVPVSVLLATLLAALPAVWRRMAQVTCCFAVGAAAASRDPSGLDAAGGASAAWTLVAVAPSGGRPAPGRVDPLTTCGT